MLAASLVCYRLVHLLGSLALAWYEDTWQKPFYSRKQHCCSKSNETWRTLRCEQDSWMAFVSASRVSKRVHGSERCTLSHFEQEWLYRNNKCKYIANIDIGNHQVHILVEQNPLHPPFQTPGSAFRYVSSAAKLVWAYYALQTATVCIYKYSNNLQAHKHLNGVSQQSLQVSVHSKPIRTSGRSIMVLRYQRIWDVGGCPTTQRAANSLTNLTTGNRMQRATSTDFLAPLLFLSSVSGGLAWPCDAVCLSYHP